MKQQPTSDKQGQLERNPTPMDPPERNPAEIEVNSIDIAPKNYSWMQLTNFSLIQRKPSMTQPQLAYPKNFGMYDTNFVSFFLAKKQPSLYLMYKYP